MGEVYKARDTRLDRTVAVKVVNEQVAASPDRQSRFEREARTSLTRTLDQAAGSPRREGPSWLARGCFNLTKLSP
jgi:serine/threonine protein kinase